MTTDAGLDLFKAVRNAIVADGYLSGQVSTRVFSSWDNQTVVAPFIRMWLGTTQQFEMDGGGNGSETDFSVYVFTKESAPILCRTIAAAMRDLLDDGDETLTLDGSDFVSFQFKDIIMSRDDEDPTLQMAVVRFTALTTSN